MAVLLSICAMIVLGQDPDHKQKKVNKNKETPVYAVDTVTVSVAVRLAEAFNDADSIFTDQINAMSQLDSLIQEKQKK